MHRIATVWMALAIAIAGVACSNDDGNGDAGTNDAGMMADGGGAFTCTRSRQCRQEFDNKPVCDLGAIESSEGRCRACEISSECPGTTVCWTGRATPECVTDCEEDAGACESDESCQQIMQKDGTTVQGCVPSE